MCLFGLGVLFDSRLLLCNVLLFVLLCVQMYIFRHMEGLNRLGFYF